MAVVIQFPVRRALATRDARARRVFEAQQQLEQTERHARMFAFAAVAATAVLMAGLQIASML